MNLLAARTEVRNNISQPNASASDFTDTELNGIIDKGVRGLGLLVKKPIKSYAGVQVSVNTNSYPLSTYWSDLIIPTVAYFGDGSINGDIRKLRVVPEEELAEMSPSWFQTAQNQLGRPAFLLRDSANFYISPTPSAVESATGKLLYIRGIYQPAPLTNDTTALDLPLALHDLAVRMATAYCYLDNKLNNSALGQQKKNDVEADAKKVSYTAIKESESPGFYWGSAMNVGDDDYNGLRMF